MISDIKRIADEIEDKVISYRRDFHKYAEYGWTEFRTSSLIARRLKNLGFEVKVGREISKEEDRMGLPPKEILDYCWDRALKQGGDEEYLALMKDGFTGVVGIIKNGEGTVKALR